MNVAKPVASAAATERPLSMMKVVLIVGTSVPLLFDPID
jgi:hypothetical protein